MGLISLPLMQPAVSEWYFICETYVAGEDEGSGSREVAGDGDGVHGDC